MIGLDPFLTYEFMARGLLGGCALVLAAAPLGVFLVLRRMSLIGDAVGHAILPGAAGAALISGGATLAVTFGAALTGLLVFSTAGWASRLLRLPEDAGFAVFYLMALSCGVMLANVGGGVIDLDRLLFGAALALDNTALIIACAAAAISMVGLRLIYRPLLIDSIDPTFLRNSGGPTWAGPVAQSVLYGLLALATVASFHALGALMSIGLTILPAIAARFWARQVPLMMLIAVLIGWGGVYTGLLASFYFDVPAGSAIVAMLVISVFASSLIGRVNSVLTRRITGSTHAVHAA